MKIVNLDSAYNRNIFDAYLGLNASGYNIANPGRIGTIFNLIGAENWRQQTLEYFRFARINDGRINPYWPRAFILVLTSLLHDQLLGAVDPALIRTHLTAVSNLSSTEVDDTVVGWAAAFPGQALLFRTAQTYAEARTCYRDAIQGEIRKNGIAFEHAVLAAQDRLQALFPLLSPSPVITVILNPLQVDPLTDVVRIHDRTYILTSYLRVESYVHEQIHISIEPYLHAWKDQIARNVRLLDPVYDRMAYMSYAWDHSTASWHNVFSETLTRVITLLICDNGDPELREQQIKNLVQEGFYYARPMAETILMKGKGKPLSDEWLQLCFRSCALAAKHRYQPLDSAGTVS